MAALAPLLQMYLPSLLGATSAYFLTYKSIIMHYDTNTSRRGTRLVVIEPANVTPRLTCKHVFQSILFKLGAVDMSFPLTSGLALPVY